MIHSHSSGRIRKRNSTDVTGRCESIVNLRHHTRARAPSRPFRRRTSCDTRSLPGLLHITASRPNSLTCYASSGAGGGYKQFGSFMGDATIEELLSRDAGDLPENPYRNVPTIEEPVQALERPGYFRKFFQLEDATTFLNHGAFGAVPTFVADEQRQWRAQLEAQPLRFLDRELFPHLVRSMHDVGAAFNVSPRDLALVPNATTALQVAFNAVLSSNKLGPGKGVVVSLSNAYGAVKSMVRDVVARSGATHVEVDVDDCSTHADVVHKVREEVGGREVGLLVVDFVTSGGARLMPVALLCAWCREAGGVSIVDAAHGPGLFDRFDAGALRGDLVALNLHKWACGPRGSGALVADRHARATHGMEPRPLLGTWGGGEPFPGNFLWQGNADYSALLAVGGALHFRAHLRLEGPAPPLEVAVQALLHASPFHQLGAGDFANPGMRLIQVTTAGGQDSRGAKALQDRLFQGGFEVPVKCVRLRGTTHLAVRISRHCYNATAEYTQLKEYLLQLRSQGAF